MFIPEVFENGRVVLIKEEDFQKAIENGQEILVFCGGWSGGYARAFGAEKEADLYEEGKECWNCYSYELKDKVLTPDDMKKFYKVIVTDGIRVYMKTGEPANTHFCSFIDWDSKYKGYSGHPRIAGVSPEEYEELRKQVDKELTLHLMEGHYDMDDVKNHLDEMKKDISGILY